MKRSLFPALSLLLIGMLLVTSCDSSKKTNSPEKSTETPAATSPASSPEASGKWKDIPIYPGAKATDNFSMSLPTNQDLKNVDCKYYETKDKVEKVASFYKTEMTKRGWEGSFMTGSDFASGYYGKDDGNITAQIVLSLDEDEGIVEIMIALGTQK